MRISIFVSLLALAGFGSLVVPARADMISGSLSGVASFTPISPIVSIDNIFGTGNDSLLGEFTVEEQSTLTFTTLHSPADFILSEGTFTETTAKGTVHGTASGTGSISSDGTLIADLLPAFKIGERPLITEDVMFTGVAVGTGPATVAISGSYFGSTVPEPSSVVLFGTVALALLCYRRWSSPASAESTSAFRRGPEDHSV
jgi:hypothetical protein